MNLGDTIKVVLRGHLTNPGPKSKAKFRLTLIETSGATSYLKLDGTWTATETFIYLDLNPNFDITVQSQALPATGALSLTIYQAEQLLSGSSNYELTYADVQNSATASSSGAVGEFHTVQRQNRPSSISTDTKTIYNGDSASLIYEGAIWKQTNTIPTSVWFRKDKTESKPILQIAAEDILRSQQKPQKLFTGDIYGFMPYLSIINIDNLEGKFFPIEWSFNAMTNITSVKLLQFFGDELTDIDYKYTLDYGNTTKVTITS